jgi:hypothetical protein
MDELECRFEHHGCGTAQCGVKPGSFSGDDFYLLGRHLGLLVVHVCSAIRGCALGPDYTMLLVDEVYGTFMREGCKKSYCTGDLCNDQGLEKTGKYVVVSLYGISQFVILNFESDQNSLI